MRRHKYNARRTVVDGITFASAAEAKRYGELKLLERAGKITMLMCQPEYQLRVGDKVIGKYRADFCYRDAKKSAPVVEDVKGMKTPLYRWKKKHVEAQYGFTIVEIEA